MVWFRSALRLHITVTFFFFFNNRNREKRDSWIQKYALKRMNSLVLRVKSFTCGTKWNKLDTFYFHLMQFYGPYLSICKSRETYRSHEDQSFRYDKTGFHRTQSPSYCRPGGIWEEGKEIQEKQSRSEMHHYRLPCPLKVIKRTEQVILLPLTVSARWWLFLKRSMPSFPSHL